VYEDVQDIINRDEHEMPLATSESPLSIQSWNELNVMVIHGYSIPHRHIVFLVRHRYAVTFMGHLRDSKMRKNE